MASTLLSLLDDIATLLDDVAVLTKVAAKRTAGVLGDDLALNAEQLTGMGPDRELPVVWAVFKGSALNKLILVPAALAISAVAPWSVVPLLMVGGLFLAYEGFEKVAKRLLHDEADRKAHHAALVAAAARSPEDLVAFEREKIRGAVRTDFILSAEIVAITLGSVATASFGARLGVLTVTAGLVTVGVYGLVAAIVKLDDVGLALSKGRGGRAALGRGILAASPHLMKGLSILGTAAMFLVGGGILTHGIPPVHHAIERIAGAAPGAVAWIVPSALDGLVGVVAGGASVLLLVGAKKLRPRKAIPAA